ncbi:hypothetical protein [Cyclobacterium roseum]|uniref:hypothetical protein n=1 Tax=Cyclobacterium roseum TaxID=2666137 RepID=UPI001390C667|nr:hypothetical protein [Cyclobacterium roseum]
MEKESYQLSRGRFISGIVLKKLNTVEVESKVFLNNQHLLDIAELGAILIPSSKIEVWENFVDGVYEINGGSFNNFVKLSSSGFRFLIEYFDLKLGKSTDYAQFPHYEVFYNQRYSKISKENKKKIRKKIKKILIKENEKVPFIHEYESSLFLFFSIFDYASRGNFWSLYVVKKDKKNSELKTIWKAKPKLTINQVLKKGIDLALWNGDYQLTTNRNSPFSTGKTLLAGLYISLKGNSINDNLDYKIVGKVLCDFFKVPDNKNISEPYKSFQSVNQKIKKEFDKFFR